MANHLAIRALSSSLRDFLQHSYDAAAEDLPACTFEALSSSKLAGEPAFPTTTCTLYLYRLSSNHHLRNARGDSPAGPAGLDLHYLVTVWGTDTDTAETEQTILGWVIRELHYHPFLDPSVLNSAAGWAPDDTVSLILADLTTEELARIWEATNRPYRLSFGLLARVVRLAKDERDYAPVVATRFTHTDNLQETNP